MRADKAQPGIAAQYPFTCPRCDDPGNVGDRVVHQRGAYVHCRCAPGGDDE